MGKPPNHPFVHRVFHEINHPFLGENSPYFWFNIQIFDPWIPPFAQAGWSLLGEESEEDLEEAVRGGFSSKRPVSIHG